MEGLTTNDSLQQKPGWMAYLLTPQVLIGGVLGFGASHLWDYGKELRDNSNKMVSEARDSVQKYAIPTPATAAATQAAIDSLESVLALYGDSKAQELLNRKLADLARLRDKQRAAEESKRQAETAQAAAAADAERAAQAKRSAEAQESAQARAAAEAEARRLQEVSAAAAAVARAARDRQALEEAKAERFQIRIDRASK